MFIFNKFFCFFKMVDKYEAKEFVSNIIGNEYVIPTLGVFDRFDDINFEELPSKFVIKCTHDSGGVFICRNKNLFDINYARRLINKSLNRNFYFFGREWPFKNVNRKIIVEKLLETNDENNTNINDYKVFCFNGVPKYILVCSDRTTNLKETFFDTKWNLVLFKRPARDIVNDIKKPSNLNKMIEFSKKFFCNIPFLRVAFYNVDDKLYFGELTFFPAISFSKFDSEEWDDILSSMLKLPEKSCEYEK